MLMVVFSPIDLNLITDQFIVKRHRLKVEAGMLKQRFSQVADGDVTGKSIYIKHFHALFERTDWGLYEDFSE